MRILFVAMAESSHTARWVKQLANTGWDMHVFDAMAAGVGLELSGVTAYTVFSSPVPTPHLIAHHAATTLWPGRNPLSKRLLPRLATRLMPPRARMLAELIKQLKPDVVHSLEMQHESYIVLEAQRLLGAEFSMPWIYSSWGSDLYLYGNDPHHRDRIKAVLAACDYYIADCARDIVLAQQLGFRGEVLGVYPGVGGFAIAEMRQYMQADTPATRRVIALKGYDGWAGRARVGLRALRQCADQLRDYSIEIYSAGKKTKLLAAWLSQQTGLRVRVIPQSSHVEILKLMGRARTAIGLSISDGTPNSMLEAMTMGALPIQSDTVSTGEWITDGVNGLLVPPEDVDRVAAAVRRALLDDDLVDQAAQLNYQMAMERLDVALIQPQVCALYERVAACTKA